MSTNPDFARGEGVAGGGNAGEKSGKGRTQMETQGEERSKGQSERQGEGRSRGGRMEGIGGGSTSELREELQHMGQIARDAAYEQMENLRARGLEKARQLEDRIVDEPLKSVAIAAAVGFVLGLMWMRR